HDLLPLAVVHGERGDATGANRRVGIGNRELHVRGVKVAAVGDQHVLGPTEDVNLTTEDAREVAGAQPGPAVVALDNAPEDPGGVVGTLEVAGGHRGTADPELTDDVG